MEATQDYNFTYDEEADVLYISFSPGEKATTAVELNDNMLLRLNRSEQRVIGLTLMDFSVLVQMADVGPRQFPLQGLQELEPEWREMVTHLLMQPPLSTILKVSMYTASLEENMPIAFVDHVPQPLAA
jgi:uncharacterized protein YuzE